MSAVSSVGSSLTQQLYQKLFDRLNTNGDDVVSLDEMGQAGATSSDTAKVFSTLDADGDGRLARAEMTPSDAFAAETLSALIAAQVGPDAVSDEEYLADWFARTDTDDDGLVSRDERQAEADLRRAAAYDTGYMSTRALMVAPGADQDAPLSIDQFQVATLRSLNLDLSRLRFAEDAPPAMLEQMNRLRAQHDLPPLTGPLTDEERGRRLDQLRADIAERDSAPEGGRGFLSRELGGMRTGEAARIAGSDLSDAMVARLFDQILTNWTGGVNA